LIVDASVSTAGYTVESKRWGAPIKAVETNLVAWFFCFVCYPSARKLPSLMIYGRFWDRYRLFEKDSTSVIASAVFAALFLIVYVIGVTTQGLRFANLTYRGTISHSLLARIRHPQYAAKLMSWFFEWLPLCGSPINVLCYLGWVGHYVGRALTEERLLVRFPDYREYCRKVRWRFLPGIW
jgi:protein-S-isoprenylcysteine O-methyltransferase Ste14